MRRSDMTTIWDDRYASWIAAGYSSWEAIDYCFVGPAHWDWFDVLGTHLSTQAAWNYYADKHSVEVMHDVR